MKPLALAFLATAGLAGSAIVLNAINGDSFSLYAVYPITTQLEALLGYEEPFAAVIEQPRETITPCLCGWGMCSCPVDDVSPPQDEMPTPVPEPGTMSLLAAGVLVFLTGFLGSFFAAMWNNRRERRRERDMRQLLDSIERAERDRPEMWG